MQSGSYSITLLRQLLFRPSIISLWCCIYFILLYNKLPQIYCLKKQFISVSLDQESRWGLARFSTSEFHQAEVSSWTQLGKRPLLSLFRLLAEFAFLWLCDQESRFLYDQESSWGPHLGSRDLLQFLGICTFSIWLFTSLFIQNVKIFLY